MDLSVSSVTAPLTKYKTPIQVGAFMYGVANKDISYAMQGKPFDLAEAAKVTIAANAGRLVGWHILGYTFNRTNPDINQLFNMASYLALGIEIADAFGISAGGLVNAGKKLVPALVAYSIGKMWDPAPVNETYKLGAVTPTYGQMAGF